MQSPLEPHNEEEEKATPLGCELENFVEEQATIVSLHEECNIKNMYDKCSYFCSSHVYLQPLDPWEDEKTSYAYEGCKMKDNYEGDEFTSSFFVGDRKTIAKEDDVVNGYKAYFGSDPKEEHRSDMESSFEIPNELKDKPPPVGCELDNLKEEIMQMVNCSEGEGKVSHENQEKYVAEMEDITEILIGEDCATKE